MNDVLIKSPHVEIIKRPTHPWNVTLLGSIKARVGTGGLPINIRKAFQLLQWRLHRRRRSERRLPLEWISRSHRNLQHHIDPKTRGNFFLLDAWTTIWCSYQITTIIISSWSKGIYRKGRSISSFTLVRPGDVVSMWDSRRCLNQCRTDAWQTWGGNDLFLTGIDSGSLRLISLKRKPPSQQSTKHITTTSNNRAYFYYSIGSFHGNYTSSQSARNPKPFSTFTSSKWSKIPRFGHEPRSFGSSFIVR